MNDLPLNVLEVPLEFEVACVIKNVKTVAVLQAFVDHVCLYTTLSPVYSEGFKEVAATMARFVESLDRKTKRLPFADKDSRLQAIQYFKDLIGLSLIKGISELRKRKKAKPIVKRLGNLIRNRNFIERMYLDEDRSIAISDDLNIICSVHGITAKEHLENFMSQISLADLHAQLGLKLPIDNPALAFFELIGTKSFNLSPQFPELKEEHMKLTDEIQELDVKMFFVRDLKKRKDIYRRFFLNYYQKLKS